MTPDIRKKTLYKEMRKCATSHSDHHSKWRRSKDSFWLKILGSLRIAYKRYRQLLVWARLQKQAKRLLDWEAPTQGFWRKAYTASEAGAYFLYIYVKGSGHLAGGVRSLPLSVDSADWTRVIRFAGRCLYWLSHLFNPLFSLRVCLSTTCLPVCLYLFVLGWCLMYSRLVWTCFVVKDSS